MAPSLIDSPVNPTNPNLELLSNQTSTQPHALAIKQPTFNFDQTTLCQSQPPLGALSSLSLETFSHYTTNTLFHLGASKL
ncbi:hypothetical protein V6Z11_D07G210800 [Gossypium hirsutum]